MPKWEFGQRVGEESGIDNTRKPAAQKARRLLKQARETKDIYWKNDFREQARMTIRSSQSEYPKGVPEDL